MGKLEVDIEKKVGNFELKVQFSAENEIMAMLGASGCGKSMTLKCIAGIDTPDSGRIVLNGKVLFDSFKKINLPPQKRKVGYMFQDYALFPNMTVLQNIQIGIKTGSSKEKQQKAKEYLTRFHLSGLEDHFPMQLSGGQKQRVAMARMLAAEPEIILLDEPFSALDSYLKWELEQEMKETLKELNKTTLFVSHNRDEVYRICNKVACIEKGHMEKPMDIKEFFHNPKSKTAAVLSGCKNISPIKRINEYKLFATDWNMTITLSSPVSESVDYVGIRAHKFIPYTKETADGNFAKYNGGKNIFNVCGCNLQEDLFEWNLFFKNDNDGKWIQWKVSKEDWNPEQIPKQFIVNDEDILLLTK